MSDLDLRSVLNGLCDGLALDEDESRRLAHAFGAGLPAEIGAAVLAALRAKGETADEVRGMARGMRELARPCGFEVPVHACDIVGTGGDGSHTYNLSTGSALVAAGAGVRVVKHGSGSVSSRSGAADLLNSLGIAVPMPDPGGALDSTGFAFLYAPEYHPAAARVATIRKAMGVRTVFNILGPLTNPAAPPFGVIGAFSHKVAALMADAISGMEITRYFVVHGEPGWDEATPCGSFTIFDVTPGKVLELTRDPEEFGIPRCAPESLKGGDPDENRDALMRVLTGNEMSPHRDALLMGAALAIEVVGLEPDFGAALGRAEQSVDSGAALRVVERLTLSSSDRG